ncbi:MAG: hypothetical protein J2P17_24615 [Mycobacterium sp.]|nr:hypothetical protein [Mycobacterium sp.]
MIKKLVAVAAVVAALVTWSATMASAYPDAGSVSKCSSGVDGTACAHLETDASSGHIRARAAATPAPGSEITILESRLDVLTTERATGQQSARTLLYVRGFFNTIPGETAHVIAGPAQEQCDTRLATFQYRAIMIYATKFGDYTLNTGWHAGRC